MRRILVDKMEQLPECERVETKTLLVSSRGETSTNIELEVPGQYLFDLSLNCHPTLIDQDTWYRPDSFISQVDLEIGKRCFRLYNTPSTESCIQPIIQAELDFLQGHPVLTDCCWRNPVKLHFHFSEPLHTDFWVKYKIGYLTDKKILNQMRHGLIEHRVPTHRPLVYDNGALLF